MLPFWEEDIGVDKNSRINLVKTWAVQGWATSSKEGCQGKKNSRIGVLKIGQSKGGKKRMPVSVDHQFHVIIL